MKNQGVSAVIGIILMVAFTVAIAVTVYVYISYQLPKSDLITNKFELNLDCENCTYYFFEINNQDIVEVNESIYSNYWIGQYWDGVFGDGI